MNILEIENQETVLFNKRNVVTVTENEMIKIDGGTTFVCVGVLALESSIGCARVAGAIIGGGLALYYYYHQDDQGGGN